MPPSMFLVARRAGRSQLKRIISNHARCITTTSLSLPKHVFSHEPAPHEPARESRVQDRWKAPLRETQRNARIEASPFADVLYALAPYVAHYWVCERDAKDEVFARALLKIVKDHETLTDSDIVQLLDCSGLPPKVNIDKVARAILGFHYDTHKYDKGLIIRLATINLDRGDYQTSRYLLAPVRDDERPGGHRLLLPDELARGFLDRVVTMDRAFARSTWAKRLTFYIEKAHDRDIRSMLIDDVCGLLEAVYDDVEGQPRTRVAAAKHLGSIYLDPRVLGINERLAVMWFERAHSFASEGVAVQGVERVAAFHLGCIYAGTRLTRADRSPHVIIADPVPSDMEKAVHYLDFAHRSIVKAAWELGRMFYLDPLSSYSGSRENHIRYFGLEPDNERAARYLYKAMLDGHRLAKIKYAEMLIYGTAHPPVPRLEAQPKLDCPQMGAPEDEEEGTEEENMAKDDAPPPTTFAPRSRLDTLIYVHRILRDTYDSATGRRNLNGKHEDSPIWNLKKLINEARIYEGAPQGRHYEGAPQGRQQAEMVPLTFDPRLFSQRLQELLVTR